MNFRDQIRMDLVGNLSRWDKKESPKTLISKDNFLIEVRVGSNLVTSSELSPIKIKITEELGKLPEIELTSESMNPLIARDYTMHQIYVFNPIGSTEVYYKSGLISSRVVDNKLVCNYVACPVEFFAVKKSKNLGKELISSVNNINKYFSVDTSEVNYKPITGNFYQFNMRDTDVAIELLKGAVRDTVIYYNDGVFKLIPIVGDSVAHLGTIPGSVDLFNLPYLYDSVDISDSEWRMKSHRYLSYHSCNLYNDEYYNNYFNNIKYYMSNSLKFKMSYEYNYKASVGDHVSATYDKLECNSLLITKKTIIYQDNMVNTEIELGDFTNELRIHK